MLLVKNPPADTGNIRDTSLIPGPGRSSGEGYGNSHQYACLENPYGQRSLVGYSPGVTHDWSDLAGMHACKTPSFLLKSEVRRKTMDIIKARLNVSSYQCSCKIELLISFYGLPRWLSGKEPACQCRRCTDASSIPGSGRSAGEGNGNPLQYSCLENPMDRRAWQAIVHWVTKSQTRLSD